jgi:hypothetical protein
LPAPWSAMVGPSASSGSSLQQVVDELVQVVDLLELAARILVELAVPREDVQLLQELDRLARAQVGLAWRGHAGPTPQRGPAVGAEVAQLVDVGAEDGLGLRERRHRAVDALLAQQVQRGVRRAVAAVGRVVGIGPTEHERRVEARQLDDAFEAAPGDQALALAHQVEEQQELVEALRQHEQRGVALGRVAAPAGGQLGIEGFQHGGEPVARADGQVHLPLDVHGLGERAQVEPDDRALEPALHRFGDLAGLGDGGLHGERKVSSGRATAAAAPPKPRAPGRPTAQPVVTTQLHCQPPARDATQATSGGRRTGRRPTTAASSRPSSRRCAHRAPAAPPARTACPG